MDDLTNALRPPEMETLTGIPSTTFSSAANRGDLNMVDGMVVLDGTFLKWFKSYKPSPSTRERMEENVDDIEGLIEIAKQNKDKDITVTTRLDLIRESIENGIEKKKAAHTPSIMKRIRMLFAYLVALFPDSYEGENEDTLDLYEDIKEGAYPLWLQKLPTIFTRDELINHLIAYEVESKEADRYLDALKTMDLIIRLDNDTYGRVDKKPFPEVIARHFIKDMDQIFRPKEIIRETDPLGIKRKHVYYRLNTMHKEGKIEKKGRGRYINPYKLSNSH